MASNETVADIVREMVEFGNHCAAFGGAYSPERWDNLCKRLIAAHKRAIAAKDAEIAKLRECLKEAICIKCGYCRDFYRNCHTICDLNKKDCDIIAKFRRALTSNVNEEL